MSIGTTAAIVAGVGAASAIGGATISGLSAKSAAGTEANAATQAAQIQKQATDEELAQQQQQFQVGQTNLAPYLHGGGEGLSALETGLGLPTTGSGSTGAASGVPAGSLLAPYPGGAFTAPTAAEAAATPGYEFALSQGEQATQRADAAQGVFGGGSQKDAANYATGLASNTYQQSYGNALSTYGTNYNTWLQNQSTKLGSLEALAGQGYSAASGSANLAAQAGTAASNTIQTGAAGQTNALESAANAGAAGTIAAGNAGASGLSSLSNIPTTLATLNYLNQGANQNPTLSSYQTQGILNGIQNTSPTPGLNPLPGYTQIS
jgi:hypothetical protein